MTDVAGVRNDSEEGENTLNKLNTKEQIIALVEADEWMMRILRTAKRLELPDWWVCAGFVRSKIWDVLHGFSERTPLADIDVIYYDSLMLDETREKELEQRLKSFDSTIPWSVKNEARMHLVNGIAPYASAVDAMSKFPETVTALGLSLDKDDNVMLSAPCDVDDVLNLRVKPTPYFAANEQLMDVYRKRITKKNWKQRWHKLEIIIG